MTFLEKLLPSEGLYCVAKAVPSGGFQHFFCAALDEAERTIAALDQQGHTVYLAQATFKTSESRKQDNALFLRNLFFDLDCGPTKDYPTQRDAADALKQFVAETGLPFPAVVVSGNGLYAHWLFADNIAASSWKTIARILKATAAGYGMKADPSRTSDSSSVLRPVGTTHRKDPMNPKPVVLVRDMEPVNFMDFMGALDKAAKKKKVDVSALSPPKPMADINADFYAGIDTVSQPSSALKIAEKCSQIGNLRSQKGNVSEPLWYAGLGVLVFCEEGADLCHEWSSGHPEYDFSTTQDKIAHRLESGTGPSTCAHLGSVNPQGCIGCAHNGKIKSPIVLGRPEPKALETEVEEEVAPQGYRRSPTGLHAEEGDTWFQFYDQDLYPVRLAFDESLGYETTTFRHHLPFEGALEFTLRSSLVHDPKALMMALTDAHVKVVGVKEKKAMIGYCEAYMQKFQRRKKMSTLYCQMGWKERHGKAAFVLGSKVFQAGSEPDHAALAKNVPAAAQGFRSQGELAPWVEQTQLFNEPRMEPFAFALLAGGFGAPLMKFTGFDGAMVSLTGASGAGKTLMLRMIQSVWGYHNDLLMLRDDTRNALVSRLGVYGNLPLAIDEITNIDGMELSDLVYRVTQGRDKVRLTKASVERSAINTWNTLAVVTSNSSLAEKLSGAKQDAGAELNRIFEYPVLEHPTFQGKTTTKLYWAIDQNFGHAGEVYAQWLVDNRGKIKEGLDKVRALIDKKAEICNEERYWSAIASTAIYGGLVAQSLGLVKFEVSRLIPWVVDCIRNMRGDKYEMVGDSISVLGQFLDEYAAHRLLVRHSSERTVVVIDPPRGSLVIRHELDTQRLFFSRSTFKFWLTKRYGSYNSVKNDLERDKILRNSNLRKTLGQGTQFGGAQQPCWEIDLKNHKLGNVGIQLVEEGEMLARAPVGGR
jgi:hypothetical protein